MVPKAGAIGTHAGSLVDGVPLVLDALLDGVSEGALVAVSLSLSDAAELVGALAVVDGAGELLSVSGGVICREESLASAV